MSVAYISYNEKKIEKKEAWEIASVLDYNLLLNKNRKLKEYEKIINFISINKLQVIFPAHETEKNFFVVDENFFVLFCGLIYNKKDLLKKYNADNLKKLIIKVLNEDIFDDFIKEINGHFLFFVYDIKTEDIFFANDKMGFYGAFYCLEGNKFKFSTSAEAITKTFDNKANLNYNAISDYLSLGLVQNRETFFKNIKNLPAATILKIKNKKISFLNYYQYDFSNNNKTLEDNVDFIHESIKKSVLEISDLSPEDTDVCLTGGFDTRLINSILLSSNKKLPVTFTRPLFEGESKINIFGYRGDEKISRQFAKKYNIEHRLVKQADYQFVKKKKTNRSLYEIHGLFGGELFGGEIYNQPATLYEMKIPSSGKIHFFTNRFKNLLSRDSIESYYKNISEIKTEEWDKKIYLYKANLIISTYFSALEKYGNIAWNYPKLFFCDFNLQLRKVSIYPFLNHLFLKDLFKIPFSQIRDRKIYSRVLEKYYSKYLKVDILHGKKRLYRYNKNTKKLYIYKKIDQEMEKKKFGKIMSDEERKIKGIKDFLYYLNSPVNLDNLDKGFFFYKNISVNKKNLLYYRINKLRDWFGPYF